MLIPFLREIPLLAIILGLLITAGGQQEATFAPVANLDPSRWNGVEIAESTEGRLNVPLFFQYHYPETVTVVDGEPRSVMTSGCGTTSLAMAIHYYHGDSAADVTPATLFQFAVDEHMYQGEGIGHSALNKIARSFQLRGEWKSGSRTRIQRWLRDGNLIIAHMATGMFTGNTGHYILLVGVTEDGKILINDPNSELLSTLAFPVETIIKEGKTDTPFYFVEMRK